MRNIKQKKLIQNISNQGDVSNSVENNKSLITKYTFAVASALIAFTLLPESAFAAKFDIDAGVNAATAPLIKAIENHWGKAVLLTASVGAVIGEGDARQRAVRAGITAGASGGVVLALLAMLT